MVSKFELKLKSYPLIVDDLSSQPNNHELFQLAEPPELAKETSARCNDFEQLFFVYSNYVYLKSVPYIIGAVRQILPPDNQIGISTTLFVFKD